MSSGKFEKGHGVLFTDGTQGLSGRKKDGVGTLVDEEVRES